MSEEQYLTFTVEDLICAIPLDAVSRVVSAAEVVPVPGSPEVLEGLLRVEDDILPVIDMRCRLGFRSKQIEPDDHFIIVRSQDMFLVLHVERAGEVVPLSPEDIRAPGEISSGIPFLEGVAVFGNGAVLIQDIHVFLSAWEKKGVRRALRNARSQ